MKRIILFFTFLISLLANAQVPTGGDLVGLHNVATTDISSITGPIVGSILYNSTTEKIHVYKVGGWTTIGDSNKWNLNGNKLSSTNFLGSINAEDLVFKANNTERIRIKQSTGNIGIGTSSPEYNLEVNGTAKINDTPTITTANKALVKNPTTGQISEQVIPTFSSNKSYVQVYKGNKTFTNGNATLLNLFPQVTIQAGKKVKMTLYVPTRDHTNHWGGLYVNVNARVNGTWYNLGNTGYDGGVMSYSAQSIHALNHEMLLDFITNLGLPDNQPYTIQFELRARSYNGTTSVNRSHDINRTANNLGVRGGLQTWASDQNYCHIIIEEKDR